MMNGWIDDECGCMGWCWISDANYFTCIVSFKLHNCPMGDSQGSFLWSEKRKAQKD